MKPHQHDRQVSRLSTILFASTVALALMCFASPTPALAELARDVNAAIADRAVGKATVGVQVIHLGATAAESKVVFRSSADAPLIPASNLKLVTTSAALDKLGADFKFRTVLAMKGQDLVLIGDGDPTLGDDTLLRRVGWDMLTVYANWADALKKAGVTTYRDLLVDDSIFDTEFYHPGWKPDDIQRPYAAQVGGLNFNLNCIDFFLTVRGAGQPVEYHTAPATAYVSVRNTCMQGDRNAIWLSRVSGGNDIVLRGTTVRSSVEPNSVTIHDPPLFAGTVLTESLATAGIRRTGQVQRSRELRASWLKTNGTGDGWKTLAIHETPIQAVLARANKDSENTYAEALCKRLGAAVTGKPGSWTNGTAAVGAFLKASGVPEAEFTLVDGSGLSRGNTISADAITLMLVRDYFSPNKDAFLASLSVAGVDGTLKRRFANTDLQKRVFGKSGYINGVSSLSGYVKTRAGGWYAFSILGNKADDIAAMKALQEKIVIAIDTNDK